MKRTSWWWGAMVVVGCGGTTRAPVASVAPAGFAPAPEYAALFERGKTWTYDITETATPPARPDTSDLVDHMESPAEITATSTCTVAEVRAFAGGIASQIDCTWGFQTLHMKMLTGEPIAGVWLADSSGLVHLAGPLPASGAPAVNGDVTRVLSAHPHSDNAGDRQVELRDHAWCVDTHGPAEAPRSIASLCIGAAGIVSGDEEFRPANPRDVETRSFHVHH